MPKSKHSLRDKVEGNELDMSMCELTSLPIDEMAKLTKVTDLDLSCNLLVSLPESFSTSLRHISKLDLSKNYLHELPITFGQLVNLQHLDLLSNRLHLLPLSFAQLRALKWLDLKDNPLEASLQTSAGDCLDEGQCRKCAQNVITFMQYANLEVERKREREMELEIAKEKQRKIQEERKRQSKKAEKDKKRREYQERQRMTMLEQEIAAFEQQVEVTEPCEQPDEYHPREDEQVVKDDPPGRNWTVLLVTTFAGLLSALVGLYCYCDKYRSSPTCRHIATLLHEASTYVNEVVSRGLHKLHRALS